MEEKIQRLITWVREHFPKECGALVPISGGTDSALAFWVYSKALPGRTVGIFFGDTLRNKEWFESVGDIRLLPHPQTVGNAEVARWATVLDVALVENSVLIGTRNRTEHILGNYSMASRVAAQQPLAGMWKSDVLKACAHVGVPEEIIASSREADPVCGRPPELAQIAFGMVDSFLQSKLGEGETHARKLDTSQREYLEGLYAYNRFKASLPLIGPDM